MVLINTERVALTDTQRRAVEAPPGKLVFLGGPGSGKSLVVAERAIWLIANGPALPSEVLVLAPSRRAALAVGDHIRERLGSSQNPTSTSFHGLALTILQHHYRDIGYRRPPKIMDTAHHFDVLRDMLLEEHASLWPYYRRSRSTRTFRRLAYDMVMEAAHNGLNGEEIVARTLFWGRPDLTELAEFYLRYRENLRREGLVDFGELLAAVVKLLSSNSRVASTYRQAYRHILVDEFEEANHSQSEILHLLVDRGTDLLIAGDPEQGINGLRSGSPSYLLACQRRLGAHAIVSTDNLRSTKRLASLAAAIRPNSGPILQEEGPEPNIGTLAEGLRESLHEPLLASSGKRNDGEVFLSQFNFPADEGRSVAEEVERLVRSGMPPARIAIIFRSLSSPLVRLIASELAHRAIPVTFSSSQKLIEEPLVRATVDLLRFLADGEGNGAAFQRILSSPLAGLPTFGFQALQRAVAQAKLEISQLATQDLDLASLQLSDGVQAELMALLSRLQLLEQKAHGNAANLLWDIWQNFPAFHKDALDGGQGSAAYARFMDEVARLQERSTSLSIAELLGKLDNGYFDSVSTQAYRRGGVAITTVHQAKGQEWEVVFLPGVLEGSFPLSLSPIDVVGHLLSRDLIPDQGQIQAGGVGDLEMARRTRHLAEERRVFYVAVSRARRRLYLSYSGRGQDGRSGGLPSRFLNKVAEGSDEKSIDDGGGAPLPLNINDAVLYHRRLLASDDPISRALALYALHVMNQKWPEAVRMEEWWDNVRETSGAESPFPNGRVSLSASRLSTYRDCPLAYQFGYHWQLGEPSGAALTIGSLLHSILEEYHRPGSPMPHTREALQGLLERQFDGKAFQYRPVARQARKALEKMLDLYYGRYGDSDSVIEVERSLRFAFGPHTVNGFIDRIDRLPSGELELIDYKTGSAIMTKDEARGDLQLALYDLAFYGDGELRALGKPAQATYLYLKGIGPKADGKRSYASSDEGRSRLVERVNAYAGGILSERFPSRFNLAQTFPDLDPAEIERIMKKGSCRFCAFGWVCPASDRGRGSE